MSKYDWSNVDSRLSFLATDCDGLVYGFTHKPKLTDWGFAPTNGFSKQVYGACCGFGFGSEWRESLEERPKEPAMSEFKVAVNNESDFNTVMALAESMGYYNGLEFKDIPKVKVLFLPNDCKHIGWSDRGIEHYQKRFGKEVSIEELKEIAAGHRIDNCKVSEMDKCREEFEKFARWYALPLDKSEDGVYLALETQSAWVACQSWQAKVDELQNLYTQQGINMLKLQKRVDAALEQVQGNLKYVEQDRRENFEFLQMAMIRAFKELEQALKGEV